MITQSDGTLLYTQEEYDTMVSNHNAEVAKLTNEIWVGSCQISLLQNDDNAKRDKVIEVFRNEIQYGTMDNDSALELCNSILSALGWQTTDSITRLFTVSVTYYDTIIAEFDDVEATDEETACQMVSDDMHLGDAEITFDISYNGQTCNETAVVDVSYYDFEFSATEIKN